MRSRVRTRTHGSVGRRGLRPPLTRSSRSVYEGEERVPRERTRPGALRFSDAVMPEAVRQWLAAPGQDIARNTLFHQVHATAIDSLSGVAKEHSLRGMEVVVPMTLLAEVMWLDERASTGTDALQDDWGKILELALPLIQAVGANRNRGYGRANLRLVKPVTGGQS